MSNTTAAKSIDKKQYDKYSKEMESYKLVSIDADGWDVLACLAQRVLYFNTKNKSIACGSYSLT